MKIAWGTYLRALSRVTCITGTWNIGHPPVQIQCTVHRPWGLFREITVILYWRKIVIEGKAIHVIGIIIPVNYAFLLCCSHHQRLHIFNSFILALK